MSSLDDICMNEGEKFSYNGPAGGQAAARWARSVTILQGFWHSVMSLQ